MVACLNERQEESPDSKGRALGNTQAEQSDTSTTENKPPMAKAMGSCIGRFGSGKGETVE